SARLARGDKNRGESGCSGGPYFCRQRTDRNNTAIGSNCAGHDNAGLKSDASDSGDQSHRDAPACAGTPDQVGGRNLLEGHTPCPGVLGEDPAGCEDRCSGRFLRIRFKRSSFKWPKGSGTLVELDDQPYRFTEAVDLYRPDACGSYEGAILSRDGQRGECDEEMLFRRIDDRGQSKADQADYA